MDRTVDYGIDLGTTNSCISRWEGGSVRVFQNNDQMNVTPSAVHILKTGRVIVGRRAYAALLTDPDNVAVEFKRWMGQKDRLRFPSAQRELSAEELSAEILKSLKEDVRRQTGTDVTTAVVTVPAAFGALQCEATARAAGLAGLEEAPLLQEPIAAAIGYGARPGSSDQRWLVFDLGGGTFDVAVVSTREGRLNVLEHRGNNLLGGKDIDRSIVEQILLPALEATYDLGASQPSSARSALLSRLRIKAEEAKIDLSTDSQVVVSLFDLDKDDSGAPIEIEVPFSRAQLAGLMEPLLEKCCLLALEALAGARLAGADLDRILLVGGPTQSPLLRELLSARLGAPVDFSADPMTVVGRGAAVYASTLERTKRSAASTTFDGGDCVHLKLAYEPVSAESQCTVAGRLTEGAQDIEIKLEAEGGLWTSGWIKPRDGFFETPVSLKEGDITTFWVYARDGQGRLLETDTPEFKVRHGLVPTAPPLPHTLSVEVLNLGRNLALDPVFSKGTPLPAEKTVKYRATHALVPDNPDSDIAIKLWEGEFLEDPDANEWIGNVLLSHDGVRRSVPEGAEIEVTIQIDASRLITVDAFVPHLNQHFSGRLYVPQRDEQDFSNLSNRVTLETQTYRQRLEELERAASDGEDETIKTELEELQRDLDELDAKAPSASRPPRKTDPDDARRTVELSKTVRGRLGRLERNTARRRSPHDNTKFVESLEAAAEVVEQFGTSLEKQQLAMLRRELERAAAKNDDKSVQRVCTEVEGLRWRVLFKHDWFWREIFDSLCQPDTPFVDTTEARRLIDKGQAALSSGDGGALREVVRALWTLQPKGDAEATRERAVRSGLRKF
ncbi:MAG: Hsp70 family protein [Candidatus Binatus sp.]|uniref:Hsp70 family protein n=1 Tax=Candidatus Binatus sp. TaxID=2811406 RepID=UPI003C7878D4